MGRKTDAKGKGGKGKGDGKCWECGKPGHHAHECTNEPEAKRKREGFVCYGYGDSETSYVTLDWDSEPQQNSHAAGNSGTTDDDCEWATAAKEENEEPDEIQAERVFSAFRQFCRGCAVIDCGATMSTTSVEAMEEVQEDMMEYGDIAEVDDYSDPFKITEAQPSESKFSYANDATAKAGIEVGIPVHDGLLEVDRVNFHVVDIPGNTTPALLGMNWLKKNRCIIDFDKGRIMFKDDPDHRWHKLPQSDKGMLLMSLTRAAVARHWDTTYGYTEARKELIKKECANTVGDVSSE